MGVFATNSPLVLFRMELDLREWNPDCAFEAVARALLASGLPYRLDHVYMGEKVRLCATQRA